MKLLSLNTHGLQEADYEEKLGCFLEFVLRERPDVIALQEVGQSTDAQPLRSFSGMVELPGNAAPLKADNHALRIAMGLEAKDIPLSWAYLPIKLGYGRYDEGTAVLSLNGEITATDVCTVSGIDDYCNWRTRKLLGVRIEGRTDWFYSVHMGWWQDAQEPFAKQWEALEKRLSDRKASGLVWLMGDFNSPAEIRGQGYDLVAASGWMDAYLLARMRDGEATVRGVIDGWREYLSKGMKSDGMRIDHIWVNENVPVRCYRTVFDGRHEPAVSDHFGVLVETGNEC